MRHDSVIDDCWNRIGVRGDGSCPELETYGHCHNCPVHAAAAGRLLATAPPAGYLEEWSSHVAKATVVEQRGFQTAVLFRVGAELLALRAEAVEEVGDPRPIHSIPHRRGGAVLGLVNVRGQLLVCASLAVILNIDATPGVPARDEGAARGRLLVLRRDAVRAVCPVDDVVGVQRFAPADLSDVPATVSGAALKYSSKVLTWRGQATGLLDEQLLFYALKRGLA